MTEFKTVCCQKFINYKKEKKDLANQEMEEFIGNKIERKMEDVINSKFNRFHNLQ